jgi:hypothetical protein
MGHEKGPRSDRVAQQHEACVLSVSEGDGPFAIERALTGGTA